MVTNFPSFALKGWFMFSDKPITRQIDQVATLMGTAESFILHDPKMGTITITHGTEHLLGTESWFVSLRKGEASWAEQFSKVIDVVDFINAWLIDLDVVPPRYMIELVEDFTK